jgi:putative peptidoglycan lipid II flippase
MVRRRKLWVRVALLIWWAGMTIGSHWPRLDLAGIVGMENDDVAFGLDKWVHVFAYFGLCVLAQLAWPGAGALGRVVPVLATLGWAAIDEITQGLAPGREVWWSDFGASSLGVGAGAVAWGLTAWLNDHDNSFVAHTRVVSALTLLSRLFGLVRDAVLARVFGLSGVYDALEIAFKVPNLFRRLFGEGALSAAFIPLYARLDRGDPTAAQRFAVVVISGLMAALMLLALVIAAALWTIAWASDLDQRGELVLRLAGVAIFYMPLICTAAVLGGLLQVHHRFGVVAFSPVLNNIALIAGAVLGYHVLFGRDELNAVAMVLAAVLVLSGAVQVIWALAAIRAHGIGLGSMLAIARNWRAATRSPEVRQPLRDLWRTALPMALGLAVFQINTLLDSLIALFFSATSQTGPTMNLAGLELEYPMQVGAVAALGRAQLLYEFPHGVFGIAVATAIFPALARAAHDAPQFAALLRQGLRLTMFIGLPASVGLILLRDQLCWAIFFPGGELTPDAPGRIAWILLGYAAAVWAYSTNMVLTRAFYARGDTITPMRLSLGLVGANLLLNLILIWPLGAAGLAWSTALCASAQTVLLLLLVRRYVPKPVDRSVAGGWAQTAGLTGLMALVVWQVARALGPIELMSRLDAVMALLICTVSGAAVVLGMAAVARMPELRWLVRGRQ